jgi:hypothetical protein
VEMAVRAGMRSVDGGGEIAERMGGVKLRYRGVRGVDGCLEGGILDSKEKWVCGWEISIVAFDVNYGCRAWDLSVGRAWRSRWTRVVQTQPGHGSTSRLFFYQGIKLVVRAAEQPPPRFRPFAPGTTLLLLGCNMPLSARAQDPYTMTPCTTSLRSKCQVEIATAVTQHVANKQEEREATTWHFKL